MRVLFWAEQFWPFVGGAEIFATRLILALRDRGFEFIVVTRQDGLDLPAEDSHEGIPVYRFPFWTTAVAGDPERLLAVRAQVAALKRSFAPDVVHLNGFAPASAFFHGLTNESDKSPYLVTLHGMLDPEHAAGDSLLAQTLREAGHVVGCSQATIRRARHLVPAIAEHSSVVRHGLPIPSVQPSPLRAGARRVVCLGRLTQVKGFDRALAAFAKFAHRIPDARLILAGDGEARPALERQVAELHLGDSVEFRGWIAPGDVPSLLNSASLVVVPSRDEGFGLVALEAAFMARPVVATRVGGLPEIVNHNETGILVADGDTDAMVDAIEYLLTHPRNAAKMGQAARKRATAEFSWTDNVSAYETLYRQLVPHDGKPGIQPIRLT